jgi:hypothetical protein
MTKVPFAQSEPKFMMGGIGVCCSVFFYQSREFLPLSTSVFSSLLFERPSRYSVGNGDVSTAAVAVCGHECSVYLSKCLCNCLKSSAPVSPSFLSSRVFGMVALRIFMKMVACVKKLFEKCDKMLAIVMFTCNVTKQMFLKCNKNFVKCSNMFVKCDGMFVKCM